MKPWKVIRLAALIILKLLLGLEAKGYTSEAKGYTSESKTGSIHQHSAPESSNKNRYNYSNNHSLYDLSAYGYTKTWTSSQFGFLVSPSYAHTDDAGYVSFDGIYSVEECAAKCHFKKFAGGEYGYDFAPQRCYCFKTIECREPRMLEKGAISFANSDPTYYDMSDYSSYIRCAPKVFVITSTTKINNTVTPAGAGTATHLLPTNYIKVQARGIVETVHTIWTTI